MVKAYKNFILVDRQDTVASAIKMAQSMGAWFKDDNRVWHVKSPRDRIVLIYQHPVKSDENIHEYKQSSDIDFKPNNCIGYILLYCNGKNVKVGDCKFKPDVQQTTYWKMLKGYLTTTIRNIGGLPSQQKYTLYWDRKVLNKNFQNTLQLLGMLDNPGNMTYTFTDGDVKATVTQNNWGNYGVSSTSNSNPLWGTTMSATPTIPAPIPVSFGNNNWENFGASSTNNSKQNNWGNWFK